MEKDLKNKIALVTGANRGLGFAISEKLATMGAKVIMVCRNKESGEEAVKKLSERNMDVVLKTADVGKTEDIDKLHDEISKEYDKIDILVNNAGMNNESPETTIETIDLDVLNKIMQVNFVGTLVMCRKFAHMVKKSDDGRIINFGSGLGQLTPARMGPFPSYSISKNAVNMVTKILADNLKDTNVKVVSLDPGWVKTDMGGPDAMLEIPEGIDTPVWLATADPSEIKSGYFYKERKIIDW